MRFIVTTLCIILFCSLAGNAFAVASGVTITYEGGGAGTVVFDGTVHAAKKLTCGECHERQGLHLPLFAMKKGGDILTMKVMERGRACGYCHPISLNEILKCEKCHRK